MAPRYALYFAPPANSPLWRFGSAAIGYDAETGDDLPLAPLAGIPDEERAELTADPRRYGFHATLKAPFRLRDGVPETDLVELAALFAAQQPVRQLSGLRVALLGRFVAAIPAGDPAPAAALADACVRGFESVRAPLGADDLARRKPETLSERQRSYLLQFGYPYVLDEFRFHMTLSGPLPEARRAVWAGGLAAAFDRQVPAGALPLDEIALFRQEDECARFRILRRFRLG